MTPPFRVNALEIAPKDPLRSGDHLTVTLKGEVPERAGANDRLGIRVRSLQNAHVIFMIDLTAHEPALREPGTFEITIDLQMNTGRGYFSIESAMWNNQERRELGKGPQAVACVGVAPFHGGTNLHPRVRVVTRPAPETRELWPA